MAKSEPYIPAGEPFYATDGFRAWETSEGHYVVCNDANGNTYRGDLKGVALFIERERKTRSRSQ